MDSAPFLDYPSNQMVGFLAFNKAHIHFSNLLKWSIRFCTNLLSPYQYLGFKRYGVMLIVC